MDLAERISTLRRVNRLSARQVAAMVDVVPTTVTRIESGAVQLVRGRGLVAITGGGLVLSRQRPTLL